uniref:Cytochrome b5 n=1 Tax=Octopus bimaculoides TaxID=37653 RepID=A0A0L8HNN7_OCTBM
MSAEEASGKVDEDRNNEKKEGDKTDVKVYKLEHVKEHKTCKSLWLVIDNKVYDVTEFLDEHPGGEEVLLDLGGKKPFVFSVFCFRWPL